MIFANVTDIAIPQGNVVKIHETASGRMLWEKKQAKDWEVVTAMGTGAVIADLGGVWYDSEQFVTNNLEPIAMLKTDRLGWLGQNGKLGFSDTFRWYFDYSVAPLGLCLKVIGDTAYLDVNSDGVVIPANRSYNLGLYLISEELRVYQKYWDDPTGLECSTYLNRNAAAKKQGLGGSTIYYQLPTGSTGRDYYIAPDILTAPEGPWSS